MMPIKMYADTRNFSVKLVRRLINDKEIPGTKLYTRWYVDEEEADSLLKAKCHKGISIKGEIKLLKSKVMEEARRQL